MNKFDKHKTSIQKLFAENFGTSIAFIDQKGDGYLYNVFFEHPNIIQIPNFPSGTRSILWETSLENEVNREFDTKNTSLIVFSGYSLVLIQIQLQPYSVYRDSLKESADYVCWNNTITNIRFDSITSQCWSSAFT